MLSVCVVDVCVCEGAAAALECMTLSVCVCVPGLWLDDDNNDDVVTTIFRVADALAAHTVKRGALERLCHIAEGYFQLSRGDVMMVFGLNAHTFRYVCKESPVFRVGEFDRFRSIYLHTFHDQLIMRFRYSIPTGENK